MRFRYLRAASVRLAAGVPVFFLVTFLGTALSDFMPGSAAQAILGQGATTEAIATLNAQYGFDRPVWVRYFEWLANFFQGNLGTTLFSQQSIAGLLLERAAVTFEIAILAMTLALTIAIPTALFAAMRSGSRIDSILRGVSSFMLSVPIFVTVVIASFVFAITLKWLPAGGWATPFDNPLGNLGFAALPVLSMAFGPTAYFYRLSRNEFASTLQEDFVLVARAKGLPTRYILLRHVLRPSLTQVLTVLGLQLSWMLGGSFIVESYFAVPGIGWTMLSSVGWKDMPVVQAILTLVVMIYVLMFILVDIGYALIDPRVSVS